MTTGPDDLTDDLNRGWQGDQAALERALSEVYRRLKLFAGREMRHQPNDHTLQATALVHEAYLRMVKGEMPQLRNRAHFESLAIQIMKQILIDYARRKRTKKREGVKVMFEEVANYATEEAEELVRLDDALKELNKSDKLQATIVELKYFGGMTDQEVAKALDTSVSTVRRHYAKALPALSRYLNL